MWRGGCASQSASFPECFESAARCDAQDLGKLAPNFSKIHAISLHLSTPVLYVSSHEKCSATPQNVNLFILCAPRKICRLTSRTLSNLPLHFTAKILPFRNFICSASYCFSFIEALHRRGKNKWGKHVTTKDQEESWTVGEMERRICRKSGWEPSDEWLRLLEGNLGVEKDRYE